MPSKKLYKGTFVRQVLKWKKWVRIAFIPDNGALVPDETPQRYDLGKMITWKKFLTKDNPNAEEVNIDAGILLLKFNSDMKSGTATFLPADKKQKTIINRFTKTGSDNENSAPPTSSPKDFENCVSGKVSSGTNWMEASILCGWTFFK